MLDTSSLRSVALQLMNAEDVLVRDQRLPVRRTSRRYFRNVTFTMHGHEYMAIEQNAAKPSYWGKLAREGHQVVQFKDLRTNRFVAVAVDGQVKVYEEMANHRAA